MQAPRSEVNPLEKEFGLGGVSNIIASKIGVKKTLIHVEGKLENDSNQGLGGISHLAETWLRAVRSFSDYAVRSAIIMNYLGVGLEDRDVFFKLRHSSIKDLLKRFLSGEPILLKFEKIYYYLQISIGKLESANLLTLNRDEITSNPKKFNRIQSFLNLPFFMLINSTLLSKEELENQLTAALISFISELINFKENFFSEKLKNIFKLIILLRSEMRKTKYFIGKQR